MCNVVYTLFQCWAPTLHQRYVTLKMRRRISIHFQRRFNVISTLIHNVQTTLIWCWDVDWDIIVIVCLPPIYILKFYNMFCLCSQMWHYVLSRIWRNLHINIDTEIDKNRISEKLLKLGGSVRKFYFQGESLSIRGS